MQAYLAKVVWRGHACPRHVATAEAAAGRYAPAVALRRAESTGQESRVQTPGTRARDDLQLAAPPATHSSLSATRNASRDAPVHSGLRAKRYATARSIPILRTSCAPAY